MTDETEIIQTMNSVCDKLAEMIAELVKAGVLYDDDVTEILDDLECNVWERLSEKGKGGWVN
jgi:polyhydroxyalkanoate synthesis regulator phasin